MNNWPIPKQVNKFYAFPYLYEKYGEWLRPEIKEVNLFHHSGKCYLEIVSDLPHLKKLGEQQKLIQEIDLSFISCFENPAESIFDDARTLIEYFDPYSIINTLPLFTDVATVCVSNYHQSMANT